MPLSSAKVRPSAEGQADRALPSGGLTVQPAGSGDEGQGQPACDEGEGQAPLELRHPPIGGNEREKRADGG
jgi:hypothetical protein